MARGIVVLLVVLGLAVAGGQVLGVDAVPDTASMVTPTYTDDGALVLPTDYREWIFVGSSLGLSYFGAEPPSRAPVFHHVYMQPEAYRHYVETGTFPEKTMLVMENYSAGTKENNTTAPILEDKAEFQNLHGQFEDKRVGLEVALKDSETFEDGWAYFNFTRGAGLAESAKAFPKSTCWDCHDAHAADDNVFVQFYPVLREHLEKRLGIAETK